MTAATVSLTDFLLARIAEDEARADFACEWYSDDDYVSMSARVLAECEAKRRIIWRHGGEVEGHFVQHDPCRWAFTGLDNGEPCGTLRDLAAIYSDNPDFNPEWRP